MEKGCNCLKEIGLLPIGPWRVFYFPSTTQRNVAVLYRYKPVTANTRQQSFLVKYSFSEQKVLRSNLPPSLVTLAVQREPHPSRAVVEAPSVQPKSNQAVRHMTQFSRRYPQSRLTQMPQPTKPSPSNDTTHKAVSHMTQFSQAVTHE
ncbi:hypothetical protein TNCV_4705301 [Trichonephila clavipes]|nr:hypothetical protein TNCV_4705301 [Trichonephila clavipes]